MLRKAARRTAFLCALLATGCTHMPQGCERLNMDCVAKNKGALIELTCIMANPALSSAACLGIAVTMDDQTSTDDQTAK